MRHSEFCRLLTFGLVPAFALLAWRIMRAGIEAQNPYVQGWLVLAPLVLLFVLVVVLLVESGNGE